MSISKLNSTISACITVRLKEETFPIAFAMPLKLAVLLSSRDWCPLHLLAFTFKHDLLILQDESASFFSHSGATFLIFLPKPSISKTSYHGTGDINQGRIPKEHPPKMNLLQLFINNIWLSLCSLILVHLGFVSIPTAPVSLQPVKIKSEGKIISLQSIQVASSRKKVKQSIWRTEEECLGRWNKSGQ